MCAAAGLATYLLLWPEDGILRKDEVRRVFDGSIFQYKADQYAEKQQGKRQGRKQVKRETGAWWSHATTKVA